MLEKQIMVSSRKCGAKTPSTLLKMDLDEKMMVCPNCLKAKKTLAHDKKTDPDIVAAHTPATESSRLGSARIGGPRISSIERRGETPKVINICSACHYKYNFNPETQTPRNCPYCGKSPSAF